MQINKLLTIFLVTQTIIGCACCSVEARHNNFKEHHQSQVGKKATDPSSYVARYPQTLIRAIKLPNGNIEFEYKRLRSCRYFYEIDSKTNIIISWRFEGETRDCTIAL